MHWENAQMNKNIVFKKDGQEENPFGRITHYGYTIIQETD